jgi:hypothetical protein
MFNRDNAIDELIQNDIHTIQDYALQYGDNDYLGSILRCGFKGYEHYTDEELMQELQERDISILFGECDD